MQNFTRIILIVILWNITVTLQQDHGPRAFHVSMPETWHTALNVCKVTDSLLLPELSDRPLFQDQLKETMQPGDFVWINAKQLTINFTYSRKYLRLAYAFQNLTLQDCLCFDGKRYSLCGTGGARISWREAAGTCGSMGTWQAIEPSSVQRIVGLLKDEMPVWLQKYRNNILPETESDLCIGLERQTDGSFADRVDNCSSKHSFFCVRDPDKYSPTLTRLSEPVSVVTGHGDHGNKSVPVDEHPKDRESNADNEDTARPGLVVGVVGGLAALLVVLLVGFGGRYVLRRFRLRQQYRKSRRRYNDRKTTLSSRSEAETRRDMSRPSVQSSGFTKTALSEGEYEKSYSTLQNDVVRQCKTRMMSDLRGRDSQAPLKPYHSMDGLNKEGDALQELDGYEDYNPQCTDLTLENGRLHVAGFPAPDQEMYENTRPVKQKTANIVKKANGRSQEDAATPALPGHKMKVHGVRSQRGDNYDDPRARVETYDIPPKRQKGRFRLQKNSNKKTTTNMEAEQTQLLRTKEMVKDVATIDDLDAYENSSTPTVGRKEVNSIDDLDCYENYLLTQKEAQ
ncbi:uncharacterized protein LOC128234925 [Mya arenaria]|uniref:uncharacterized protein LOC128234925 n=1 Tax=Mya arenaria TaxID=6604 RepID=UPI0022DF26AA|nr:uncharacterized protein LOC128234925 [Mya arenaria]